MSNSKLAFRRGTFIVSLVYIRGGDNVLKIMLRSLRYYWRSTCAVILILVMIGTAFLYTLQTTEQMTVQASDELMEKWRTGYDLLVSPITEEKVVEGDSKDLQSEEVLGEGLVRRADLAKHHEGISLEQYEKIKRIGGIEVAAPLSFIGYIENDGLSLDYGISEPGFYIREGEIEVFDGERYRDVTPTYEADGMISQIVSDDMYDIFSDMEKLMTYGESGWSPVMDRMGTRLRTGGSAWSLVAIDPEQESQLLQIDQAIVSGTYFTEDDEVDENDDIPTIPIILLNQPYETTFTTNVYQINVEGDQHPDDILANGGGEYLRSLPKDHLFEINLNPFDEEYLFYFNDLIIENGQLIKFDRLQDAMNRSQQSYVQYQYSDIEFNKKNKSIIEHAPVVEAIPQGTRNEQISYRTVTSNEAIEMEYNFDFIGRFDASLLENAFTTSEQPLPPDYYKPEDVFITHHVDGTPYEEALLYQNSPYKDAYYTGGIDAITTLAVADLFLGEKPISIIRVIVDGVGERNDESMAKVERIAEEIRRETGLHVDIMLGAADRKVHVLLNDYEDVDGYGYLLEGWSTEGTSFVIEDRISGTTLMLALFILMMGFICLSLVYRQYTENRKRDFAVQYTFGWSRTAILRALFIEAGFILILVITCLITLYLLANPTLSMKQFLFATIICVVIAIISIGLLYVLPVIRYVLRNQTLRGVNSNKAVALSFKPSVTLWAFIVRNVLRHPLRSFAKSLIIIVTLVYISLFLITKQSASTFLSLTFLGESIDTSLQSYQWFLFIMGIILAFVSYIAIHLHQTESRIKEIQLFQAWGWHTKRWVSIYIIEEFFIASVSIGLGMIVSLQLISTLVGDLPIDNILLSSLIIGGMVLTLIISASTLFMRSNNIQLREFH